MANERDQQLITAANGVIAARQRLADIPADQVALEAAQMQEREDRTTIGGYFMDELLAQAAAAPQDRTVVQTVYASRGEFDEGTWQTDMAVIVLQRDKLGIPQLLMEVLVDSNYPLNITDLKEKYAGASPWNHNSRHIASRQLMANDFASLLDPGSFGTAVLKTLNGFANHQEASRDDRIKLAAAAERAKQVRALMPR